MRRLRKPLSWLLTVTMLISLFCGMIPTASAAESESEESLIAFDYTETELSGLYRTLYITVQDESGEELDTLEVNNYYSTGSSTNTITLQSEDYAIVDLGYEDFATGHVFTLLSYGKDSCSFSFNFTSSDATLVLTVREFGRPEVDEEIETGATIEYRIYETQLLKMLYLAGVEDVDIDTEIEGIQFQFIRNYASSGDHDFLYKEPAGKAGGP